MSLWGIELPNGAIPTVDLFLLRFINEEQVDSLPIFPLYRLQQFKSAMKRFSFVHMPARTFPDMALRSGKVFVEPLDGEYL